MYIEVDVSPSACVCEWEGWRAGQTLSTKHYTSKNGGNEHGGVAFVFQRLETHEVIFMSVWLISKSSASCLHICIGTLL